MAKSGQSVDEQYDQIKEIYYDVCQLDVMSNIEIDKAKKEYPVDSTRELKRMRKKYENILTASDGRKRTPYFLGFIAYTKKYKNVNRNDYQKFNTSMDYLHTCINNNRSGKSMGSGFLPVSDIFKPKNFDKDLVNKKQIVKIIKLASNTSDYIKMISGNAAFYENRYYYITRAKEELLYEINRMKINEYTIYRLLKNMDNIPDTSTKNLLFYVLFNYKNDILTSLLLQHNRVNTFLCEDKNGEIDMYGIKFCKKSSPKAIL